MLATVTLIAGYRAGIAPRGVAATSASLRLACGAAGRRDGRRGPGGLLIMLGYSPIDLQTVFVAPIADVARVPFVRASPRRLAPPCRSA